MLVTFAGLRKHVMIRQQLCRAGWCIIMVMTMNGANDENTDRYTTVSGGSIVPLIFNLDREAS